MSPNDGGEVGVGVLVSGAGSNLEALLTAQARGEISPARIRVVISNVPGAGALARAERAQVPRFVVDHRPFGKDRAAFEAELIRVLREHEVGLVALAGFMRLLGATFLSAFPDRVVNVHPSLLPSFPGMHAARQALDYGVRVSGCTVHLVDEGCDTGPILMQAVVPVEPDDDELRLQRRIQQAEHEIYPRALSLLARGAFVRDGRRVRAILER